MKGKITFLVCLSLSLFFGRWVFAQTDTTYTVFATPLESFEKNWVDGHPPYWAVVQPAEQTVKWQRKESMSYGWWDTYTMRKSGSYSAYLPAPAGLAHDHWLISPKYQLPWYPDGKRKIDLSFWCASIPKSSWAEATTRFEVRLSTKGRNIEDFDLILDTVVIKPRTENNSFIFTEKTYPLPFEGYKGEAIYIAFHAITGIEDGGGLAIDDMILSPEGCGLSKFELEHVAIQDAWFKWDGFGVEGYQIKYKPKDSANFLVKDFSVDEKNGELSGLLEGVLYEAYLNGKTENPNLKPKELGPIEFLTSCFTISSKQHETSFYRMDSFPEYPPCWEVVPNPTNANPGFIWSFSGGKAIWSRQYGSANNSGANDWLLSPTFQIPETGDALKMKMQYRTVQTYNYNPEVFSIWFVPDRNSLTEELGAICLLPSKTYYFMWDFSSLQLDLSSIKGKTGRIGIHIETPGPYSLAEFKNFALDFVQECMPIENLNVFYRSDSSLALSWNSVGSDFELKYDSIDFNPDQQEGIQTDILTTHLDTLVDLQAGTLYYINVRRACTNESKSAWTQLKVQTQALIQDFPYVEGFESWSSNFSQEAYTNNWTVVDGNNDQYGVFRGRPGIKYGSSIDCAGSDGTTVTKTPRNQWLISPQLLLPSDKDMVLSFMIKSGIYSAQNFGRFEVLISETLDTSKFTVLNAPVDYLTATYSPVTIDLSDYRGKRVYIAIHQVDKLSSTAIYVDMFRVAEATNPLPKNVKVEGTTHKSVSLSWEGTAPKYNVRYQRHITNPEDFNRTIIAPSVTQNQITMDGLTPGTYYYFYVQSEIGGEKSEWVGPIFASTSCNELSLPFFETFDGWTGMGADSTAAYPIGCWKYINLSRPLKEGASMNDNIGVLGYEYGGTPWQKGVGLVVNGNGMPADTGDRYVITPQIRMPRNGALMSYWISPVYTKVYYDVLLSTEGSLPNDFTYVLYSDSLINPTGEQKYWSSRIVELRDKSNNLFPDSLVYIAFRFKGKDADGYGSSFRLDDVLIEELLPSCSYPDPVQSLPAQGIDIQLSWKSTAPRFEILYSDTLFNPYENQTIGTRLFCEGNGSKGIDTLTNLQPGKLYYIWIRGLCEGGKQTRWTYFTVVGGCGLPISNLSSIPYLYNFHQWTKFEKPDPKFCWTTHGLLTEGFIGMDSGDGGASAAQSGNYVAYMGDPEPPEFPARSQMNEWLISPQIQIELTDTLYCSFKYKLLSTYFDEVVDVMVSTTNKVDTSFTKVMSLITPSSSFRSIGLDLTPYCGKKIYIAFVHRTQNNTKDTLPMGQFTIGEFKLEKNPCPAASYIQYAAIDANDSLLVTWSSSDEQKWKVLSSYKDFIPSDTPSAADSVITQVVTGGQVSLEIPKRTNRIFYIRSMCSSSEVWAGSYIVNNNQDIKNYPYTEDFQKWTAIPKYTAGWQDKDYDEDGLAFILSSKVPAENLAYKPKGRGGSVGLTVYRAGGRDKKGIQDNWLFSPKFDLQDLEYPMMEIWAMAGLSGYNYASEAFQVFIANSPDTGSMASGLVKEVLVADRFWENDNGVWDLIQMDLKKAVAKYSLDPTSIYIGFKYSDNDSLNENGFLYLDDFRVYDVGESQPIADFSIDTVSDKQAELSWSTEGNASSYYVRYATSMFDPWATNITSKLDSTDYSPSQGKYAVELEGLQSGADYYMYISPKWTSPDTRKIWYGPYLFKTDCPPIDSFPFLKENFNSFKRHQDLHFGCWNVVDVNQDHESFKGDASWDGATDRYVSFSTSEKVDTLNEWLISPSLILPLQSELSFKFGTGAYVKEKFDVLIGLKSQIWKGDGTYKLEAFTTLERFDTLQNSLQPVLYTRDELNLLLSQTLSNYEGEEVYVAFHLYTAADSLKRNYFALDDISFTSVYPCYMKPGEITVLVDTTKAEVSWIGMKDQSEWELVYNIQGEASIDTIRTTTPKLTLTNLLPNYTNYELKIRAVCSGDPEKGPWTDIKFFTTEPTCKPLSGSQQKQGVDTVFLSWYGSPTPSYDFWHQQKGAAEQGNRVYLTKTDTIVRGLTAGTVYEYGIRRICRAGDTSRVSTYTYKTFEFCAKPYNVFQLNPKAKKAAALSWEAKRASSYKVAIRLEGETNWVSYPPQVITFILLQNLKPDSRYICKVQSECEIGNFSGTDSIFITTLPLDIYKVFATSNNEAYGTVQGEGSYNEETQITLTATPKEGYKFRRWENGEGEILGYSPTYTFELTKEMHFTAIFVPLCPAISNLQVINAKVDSVMLHWNGTAERYELTLKKKDDSEWSSYLISKNDTMLSGLQVFTQYEWKVRSICEEDSSAFVDGEAFIPVAIEAISSSTQQLLISPNPAKEFVRVKLDSYTGKATWQLVTLEGKLIQTQETKGVGEITFDLRTLPAAVYLIHVKTDNWDKVERLIIQ